MNRRTERWIRFENTMVAAASTTRNTKETVTTWPGDQRVKLASWAAMPMART